MQIVSSDQAGDIVDIANELMAAARDQVAAAESGDWATVIQLADRRDTLLQRLDDALAGGLPASAARRTFDQIIGEVQRLDDQLMASVEQETARLAEEMQAVRRGKHVAAAYGRTGAAASIDVVNRYG